MKKYISAVMILMLLAGCEDAAKAIDKAQEITNNTIDSLQEKTESLNINDFSVNKINEVTESGKSLIISIEKALTADFTDQAVLAEIKESISNAYSCLIEASSESSAQKIMDKLTAKVSSESVKSLIDSSIEKAKEVQKCVK